MPFVVGWGGLAEERRKRRYKDGEDGLTSAGKPAGCGTGGQHRGEEDGAELHRRSRLVIRSMENRLLPCLSRKRSFVGDRIIVVACHGGRAEQARFRSGARVLRELLPSLLCPVELTRQKGAIITSPGGHGRESIALRDQRREVQARSSSHGSGSF